MKVSITQATSGPGPGKQNYRMASILSFLSDWVSGSTYQDGELVWPLGQDEKPIAQSERLYAIHRTLVTADMDPTDCSPNATIAGLYIALNNRHAVVPGWYEYSSCKRAGIKCRVYVGARDIRALEIRTDPFGIKHDFVGPEEDLSAYFDRHIEVLQAHVVEARTAPGITDFALASMKHRVRELQTARDIFTASRQSEQALSKLLDQLRGLYELKTEEAVSLWDTIVHSTEDDEQDMAEISAAIARRKMRMNEDEVVSMRNLLRKLGYSA